MIKVEFYSSTSSLVFSGEDYQYDVRANGDLAISVKNQQVTAQIAHFPAGVWKYVLRLDREYFTTTISGSAINITHKNPQ